jgi:hypothetical protein
VAAARLARLPVIRAAAEQRRARDRLVLAAGVALVALAAALLLLGDPSRRTTGPGAVAAVTVGGLARRGQALADRQLQLLEELVRDEPDPHRRRGLVGVDIWPAAAPHHRDPARHDRPRAGRRWAGPVPLAVVLRAAAAEAEGSGPPGGSTC